jgi:glyoxylase-like metal-dependent hydrolase (beta-lactamase superfamily II)
MVTNEGVIMVDDKFEIDHANILAELKKITNQPVKYVVNTHHHGDHSGDNAKLQAMGAQVVTSWQARQHMVDGKQPGLSNITFDGKSSLHLGGKRVDLFYFGRGHTNGDIVALFPAQRVLAAGDLFTIGDSTPQLVDYPGGGSAKEWPQTIQGVLGLDFDQVVPGHGPVGTKADMRKFYDTSNRLKTRVHEMIVGKKSKDEISKMLRDEFHYADFHLGMSLDGLLVELR